MTKDEFKPIANKLRKIYTQDNFIADKETFDIWFEMLEDLETAGVAKAVDNYIKDNRYPPTVADIRHEYNRMYEAYQGLIKSVKTEFGLACQYYPNMDMDVEQEAFEIYLARLKKHPQGEWMPRTRKFHKDTTDFVRDCEINHKDIPPFKDYVNEQTS